MAEESMAQPNEQPTGTQPPEAAVRVVRGNPDDTELAALITALAAVNRPGEPATEPTGLSAWGAYWYRFGQRPGPGTPGWRASALPR